MPSKVRSAQPEEAEKTEGTNTDPKVFSTPKKKKKAASQGQPTTEDTTQAKEAAPAKKGKMPLKAVLKRYWYWFVTIPALIAVSFVWLYFIGAFDTVSAIVIRSSTPSDINMPVDSMYHMVVTSDSDITPVFSSNHPAIVEVTQEGFIIAHKEGTAVVTATFGRKKYEVAVTVSSFSMTWYLTAGDTFTIGDVFATFPSVSATLKDYQMQRNAYLDIVPDSDTNGQKFVVADVVPAGTDPIYVYVYSADEEDETKSVQKGVLTIWLVPTQEEKEQKMATYQESLFSEGKLMDIPPDQVDEKLTFQCGSEYDLRPPVTKSGFVQFFVDGVQETGFPMKLTQSGHFTIDAMLREFFIIAVVNNEEAYRYQCTALPRSADIQLAAGEQMLLEDYMDMMDDDLVYFAADSDKLEEIYDEMGQFIGFTALQSTEGVIHINCSPYEEKKYVTFRFNVIINPKEMRVNEGETETEGEP